MIKRHPALTCIFAIGLIGSATAQVTKRLTIGDPAPPLKVEAWVKGTPFALEKGKVYVVEFWATWCGPCIDSMPRLSDLADKMRGKIEIISVNMSDRSPAGESTPESKAHIDRISKWVTKNSDKMRYNVVLDDAAGTMAKTWMSASGQGGIPCAFVIDQEGTVAWIGHPEMGLAAVAEKVYAKKFDKKRAKNEYGVSMKVSLAAQDEKDALAKMARKGDLDAVEKAYMARVQASKHMDIPAASLIASELSKKYPAKALAFVQNRAKADMKGEHTMYGATLVFIAPNFKGNKEATKALIKFSRQTADTVKVENAAIEYAYHARVLLAVGDIAGARQWLDKATAKLSVYEPAQYRDNMKKYIDNSRAKVELEAKGRRS